MSTKTHWVRYEPKRGELSLSHPDMQRRRLTMHMFRAPRGYRCSTCAHPTRTMVVLQLRASPLWTGICLWCIEQMSEAAEEKVHGGTAKKGRGR